MILRSPPRQPPPPPSQPPPALEAPEQLTYRVFEPPSDLVLVALVRNRLLIAACAVILAVAGAAYGLANGRTYTAAATLQVGQVNPNSPGFYSYVASAGALATAFSRAVTAEPVLATIEQKLGLPAARAVSRLSAEPIPQSPIFRVLATGPSSAGATKLANVAASAIVAYESRTNSATPETKALLGEYTSASLALERARARLVELEAATRARHKGAPSALALAQAKASRDTAQTRLNAIASAYTASVTSQAPRTGLVSLLAGATTASSNRKSKTEMYGFIGLIAGAVIGCVLAIVRERRRKGVTGGGMNGKVREPAPV